MPITSIPWSSSAPAKPTGMSKAGEPTQNAYGVDEPEHQRPEHHAGEEAGRSQGARDPWRIPSIMSTIRSASLPAGSTRRTTRSAVSGKATTSDGAEQRAEGRAAPATCAACDTARRRPRRPTADRRPAEPRPADPRTVRPSKIRSTATRRHVALKRARRTSRVAAKTRTSSPARKGSRLFAMNPIATACQSGGGGSGAPDSSRSRSRQRTRRMRRSASRGRRARSGGARGRVADVAHHLAEVDAAERPDQQRDREHRCRRDRRRSASPPGRPGAADSGLGKRERDEVEQLLEQRPDGREIATPRRARRRARRARRAARSSAARPR